MRVLRSESSSSWKTWRRYDGGLASKVPGTVTLQMTITVMTIGGRRGWGRCTAGPALEALLLVLLEVVHLVLHGVDLPREHVEVSRERTVLLQLAYDHAHLAELALNLREGLADMGIEAALDAREVLHVALDVEEGALQVLNELVDLVLHAADVEGVDVLLDGLQDLDLRGDQLIDLGLGDEYLISCLEALDPLVGRREVLLEVGDALLVGVPLALHVADGPVHGPELDDDEFVHLLHGAIGGRDLRGLRCGVFEEAPLRGTRTRLACRCCWRGRAIHR